MANKVLSAANKPVQQASGGDKSSLTFAEFANVIKALREGRVIVRDGKIAGIAGEQTFKRVFVPLPGDTVLRPVEYCVFGTPLQRPMVSGRAGHAMAISQIANGE